MRILFGGFRSGTIKTLMRLDTEPESTTQEFRDRSSALNYLRRFTHDPFLMASLRKFLAQETCRYGVFRMSDHDVLEQISWQLVTGKASIDMLPTREPLEFSATAAPGKELFTPPLPTGVKPMKPVIAEEEEKKTSRFDIELTGVDNKPIPDGRYEIVLPNGKTVAKGNLDKNGFAREAGFEPGTCQVSLADLDKEAWERI